MKLGNLLIPVWVLFFFFQNRDIRKDCERGEKA